MSGKVAKDGRRKREGRERREKARFEGGKCAKEMSKESFSGKSNPENPITGSKSGVSEESTVKKGRF